MEKTELIMQSIVKTLSSSQPHKQFQQHYPKVVRKCLCVRKSSFRLPTHKHTPYDKNAPAEARSGLACLTDGLGDCDDQTNAYLSLLRTKGIPGWYVLGALTDEKYDYWEAHAWGYILYYQ